MKIEGGRPLATLIGLLILSQDSLIFIIIRFRLLQEVNLHTFELDLVYLLNIFFDILPMFFHKGELFSAYTLFIIFLNHLIERSRTHLLVA